MIYTFEYPPDVFSCYFIIAYVTWGILVSMVITSTFFYKETSDALITCSIAVGLFSAIVSPLVSICIYGVAYLSGVVSTTEPGTTMLALSVPTNVLFLVVTASFMIVLVMYGMTGNDYISKKSILKLVFASGIWGTTVLSLSVLTLTWGSVEYQKAKQPPIPPTDSAWDFLEEE